MIPAIIDIEASGFGRRSYPIEIGVVLPDRESHCFIIRPPEHWDHWDSAAEAVHHIPRSLLLDKGLPPEEVAARLNQLLSGETVYSDAWCHDLSWLGKLFDICGQPLLFRLEGLRYLLSEAEAALWHPTKAQVLEELRLHRHRASSDARVLQETYLRVTQKVSATG